MTDNARNRMQNLLTVAPLLHEYTVFKYGDYRLMLLQALIWSDVDKILQKEYYVLLEDVRYFSGPLKWRGTRFEIAADEDFLAHKEKLRPGSSKHRHIKLQLEEHALIRSRSDYFDVIVVAGSVTISDTRLDF